MDLDTFYTAVQKGDVQTVRRGLDAGVDLRAQRRWSNRTALHVASEHGRTEVAALLIEHGADLKAGDDDDQTSLHVASRYGQTEVAALLIEHGADLEARDGYQDTPLHEAALGGHTGTCELLIRHGADVTARNEGQYTPLHLAAFCGHTGTCALLIRHGADVTARTEDTPLHLAAVRGHTGTCELLIRHGADVTARNAYQDTPLHEAALGGHTGTCELLIRHGADVTARNEYTPLHLAAFCGHTGTCALLIRHGADVTARTEDGRTPSEVAEDQETLRVLKEVIKEKLYSELLQKSGGVKTDRCKVSLFGKEKGGKSTLAESLQRGWVSARLQGWTYMYTSSAEELHDPTPGVNVGTFHIPGVGEVSLWDFAGQSEYAVTHSMFMDAENTISIVLYNIMDDTQEQDVHRWLSFIKSCNPNRQRDVILVASHADKVSPTSGQHQAAHLLQSMKAKFKDLLRISDEVFLMNCKLTRTPEMDRLKELLAKMKKAMLEHQRQTPNLCAEIIKRLPSWCQTKCSPKCPVLGWPDYVDAVKEIDPHVDEDFLRESTRFLDHLGEIIFTCPSSSDPIIVLKPNWLCTDVFGPMMAPVNFPIPRLERTSEDYVTREEIQRVFQDVADVDLLITLLQEFQLCHSYDGQTFIFPGLMKQTIPAEVWKPTPEPRAVYFGKQVQCAESTDMFSSGFFPRVQTRLMREQENRPLLWRDGAKCVDRNVEGLIKLSPDGRAANICVRSAQGDKVQCGKMLQQLENIIADVLDECSPGTGTEEKVLSARALTEHREEFYSYGKEEISKAAAEGGTIVHPSLGFTEQVSDLLCRNNEYKSLRYTKDGSRGEPEQRRNSKERADIDKGEQLPEDVEPTRERGREGEDSRLMPQTPQPKIKTPQETSTDVPVIRQGPRGPVILLISDEYGTSKGGVSTVNCDASQTLKGKAVVYATVLQLNVPEQDQEAADRDGVILIQPDPSGLTTAPNLDWLTHYHLHHFPNLPQDVTCIIGHADITDTAARNIKDKRYPHADLMTFTHVIPEDTEYYKGGRNAMKAREKEKDMLDKVHNAKAAFSVGKQVFDHFSTKYKGRKKPQIHHIFLPKPSKIFLDADVKPGGEQKVVLSIGRVRKVERLKGHDLTARALGEVVEVIRNVRWDVRGISELKDEYDISKKILEDALNSGKLKPNLMSYGTQEDIRDDMEMAHLVLMPSRSEPFGLVGLEAIAAGIPVLISNQTGLAEMILDLIKEKKLSPEHRNVIVETSVNDYDPAGDAKRWADRIVDVLQHSDSEFEKAARFKRELVESRYWEESHNAFLQACGITTAADQ
ncbi:PREDICTED: death-associated protein kinase 1-like [Branchiostoma belcheri]|uniref:Death-associated protein kinase 1-like n=1 Tax=Branchiostoma belcheri TaxID=7741 RepID=A0A6P4Z5W5_BRABE|nr:PREDICTED: death-associated protein kinase 1-like [Branchiostoma belcheri]